MKSFFFTDCQGVEWRLFGPSLGMLDETGNRPLPPRWACMAVKTGQVHEFLSEQGIRGFLDLPVDYLLPE